MIEIVSSIPDAAERWDSLADRIGAPPWMRVGWFVAWFDAFGGSPTVLLHTVDDRLAGVLPLQRRRGTLRSPTNWETPAFAPLVEDHHAACKLADALLAIQPRRLDLEFLGEEAPANAILRERVAEAGYRVYARPVMRSPYVEVGSKSWHEFEATLSRKFKADIRRSWRRLRELGQITFSVEQGYQNLDSQLQDLFRLEASGWKHRLGTAIVSDPRLTRFYTSIGHWAKRAGLLRLAFLKVDDKPIAAEMLLEMHGTLYDLKGGYDPNFGRFSPGKVLINEIIRHAVTSNVREVDLLGRADSYKLAWTEATRERWSIHAFNPSAAGIAELFFWRWGHAIKGRTWRVVRRANVELLTRLYRHHRR